MQRRDQGRANRMGKKRRRSPQPSRTRLQGFGSPFGAGGVGHDMGLRRYLRERRGLAPDHCHTQMTRLQACHQGPPDAPARSSHQDNIVHRFSLSQTLAEAIDHHFEKLPQGLSTCENNRAGASNRAKARSSGPI